MTTSTSGRRTPSPNTLICSERRRTTSQSGNSNVYELTLQTADENEQLHSAAPASSQLSPSRITKSTMDVPRNMPCSPDVCGVMDMSMSSISVSGTGEEDLELSVAETDTEHQSSHDDGEKMAALGCWFPTTVTETSSIAADISNVASTSQQKASLTSNTAAITHSNTDSYVDPSPRQEVDCGHDFNKEIPVDSDVVQAETNVTKASESETIGDKLSRPGTPAVEAEKDHGSQDESVLKTFLWPVVDISQSVEDGIRQIRKEVEEKDLETASADTSLNASDSYPSGLEDAPANVKCSTPKPSVTPSEIVSGNPGRGNVNVSSINSSKSDGEGSDDVPGREQSAEKDTSGKSKSTSSRLKKTSSRRGNTVGDLSPHSKTAKTVAKTYKDSRSQDQVALGTTGKEGPSMDKNVKKQKTGGNGGCSKEPQGALASKRLLLEPGELVEESSSAVVEKQASFSRSPSGDSKADSSSHWRSFELFAEDKGVWTVTDDINADHAGKAAVRGKAAVSSEVAGKESSSSPAKRKEPNKHKGDAEYKKSKRYEHNESERPPKWLDCEDIEPETRGWSDLPSDARRHSHSPPNRRTHRNTTSSRDGRHSSRKDADWLFHDHTDRDRSRSHSRDRPVHRDDRRRNYKDWTQEDWEKGEWGDGKQERYGCSSKKSRSRSRSPVRRSETNENWYKSNRKWGPLLDISPLKKFFSGPTISLKNPEVVRTLEKFPEIMENLSNEASARRTVASLYDLTEKRQIKHLAIQLQVSGYVSSVFTNDIVLCNALCLKTRLPDSEKTIGWVISV